MQGSRLGAYEILAELGSGGMGTVYRAQAVKAAAGLEAGTAVALKVIHAHLLETEGFFKRFLREAQIGQSVHHENVVRCFDCDAALVDGQQQNYLVMEYVEGQTLRDLLRELERVPEELCRHIGREVAQGLAAIHAAGVVHRDLKPENVLITPDHVVKVMDLGVARLQDESIRLSRTGAFVGSLEYAAPEQFRTAGGDSDGRADLHALGVVLYELSTGQHPYHGDSVSKVLRRILDEEPRKVGAVNPQLSPFFEEVVHTLLAKDPEARFASAADLSLVLREGERSGWWIGRAKALRVQTRRPLRRIRIPRETALHGRDGDLARLQAAYEKAKGGDGQVVLVEGEAGIGKTRLADEFVGRLRQEGEDVNFLFASYPPGGAATAAGAFSTAYREYFGEEGLEETLADYLKPTPILIPAFAALLRGETTPKDAEPLTKDSLQTVFVHATRALAAERPTIVLIDDLHFAPEDGRALFASLALAVPEHRVLLLGTMRPGVPEEWTAGVTRLEHAAQLPLARLGPKDLGRLLIDAFRSERLATELGLRIAQKSDGNPFFAFEIIRGLKEGQFITQQPDGTWITTQVIQDIQVPSSVLDLVNARVADLSEAERDLLDVAACCGFQFDPSLIGEVQGLPRIAALKRLGQVERRHRLVRSVGRDYVFDHHQVQEALYASLNEQLREEYHTAIAEALETRAEAARRDPKDLDGALCVDVCEHLLKGARGERALRYLDAALSHLETGYLNDQAIALADRALRVPGLLAGARRVEVLLRKDARLNLLGRRLEQQAAIEEVRALAEGEGDKALLGRAAHAMGKLAMVTGRTEEGRGQFERAIAIFREVGDRAGEAGTTVNLGLVASHLGRMDEARAWLERGIALCREVGHRQFEANATNNLGLLYQLLGRHDEARAQYDRALAIFREIGARGGEANATSNLGIELQSLDRYEEARAHYERALAIDREIGDRQGEAFALLCLGGLWAGQGEGERARDALERSLSICRETGGRWLEGYGLLSLARLADDEEQSEEARRLAQESLAVRREIRHGDGISDSLLLLGDLERRRGRVEEARAALGEAVRHGLERGRETHVARALASLACLPGGDVQAAESALAEAGGALLGEDAAHVRFLLWQATRERVHLAEAKGLLDDLVERAPEEHRESMRRNVRLHREISEAWEAWARDADA